MLLSCLLLNKIEDMKIDAFIEEDLRSLIKNRIRYNQTVKLEADKARKAYFAYRTHNNLVKYLKAKQQLRNNTF